MLEDIAVEYRGKLNVVAIDVYGDAETAAKYGVMVLPTIIFFNPMGKGGKQARRPAAC